MDMCSRTSRGCGDLHFFSLHLFLPVCHCLLLTPHSLRLLAGSDNTVKCVFSSFPYVFIFSRQKMSLFVVVFMFEETLLEEQGPLRLMDQACNLLIKYILCSHHSAHKSSKTDVKLFTCTVFSTGRISFITS